jgi:hypothetical protein
MEVTSTPTLFINGRSIGNVSQIPADTLKATGGVRREARQVNGGLRASVSGFSGPVPGIESLATEATSRSPTFYFPLSQISLETRSLLAST